MAKLIHLTENSWLIKDSFNSALLFRNSENNYELVSEEKTKNYNSMDEVEFEYGKFDRSSLNHNIENTKINGYNVRQKGDINIIEGETLPVYTKKLSNIKFVAGYWIVNFSNSSGWTLLNCPKMVTIENNESDGPYMNRLEAMNRIAVLNSRK